MYSYFMYWVFWTLTRLVTNCLQVDTSWNQQCYLWEDSISGRPKFSGTAAGLVYFHSGPGRLHIPAGDNAIHLLHCCAPQPIQVLLWIGSGNSHGVCYSINVSTSSADLNPNHQHHVVVPCHFQPTHQQIIWNYLVILKKNAFCWSPVGSVFWQCWLSWSKPGYKNWQ